ncbi:MAG: hypothetical protein R3176_05510 [Woeseiaceae bacterium]|nr:hypothetical protein [Woeseiaceae bacterium]
MTDERPVSLRQENMFENRRARLLEDHVELRIDSRSLETTLEFPYDAIGPRITYRREKPQPNYALHVLTRNAAIILFFCSLFGAFDGWRWFLAMLLSSIVFFVIHACSYKSLLTIETDGPDELELLREHPSKEQVDHFVQTLFAKRNEYIRRLYTEKSLDPSTDRASWLRWMRDRKVLSPAEYEAELAEVQRSTEDSRH